MLAHRPVEIIRVLHIPYHHSFILGAGSEKPAIGRPGDAVYGAAMPVERLLERGRLHIPEAYCTIKRGRGEIASVGRPGEAVDLLLVPFERVKQFEMRGYAVIPVSHVCLQL